MDYLLGLLWWLFWVTTNFIFWGLTIVGLVMIPLVNYYY
jgi:hypothetical protein